MNTTAHETPTPGSIWTHRSGRKYRVLLVANDAPDPKPPYLPIVVYMGVQNGKFRAGLLSDWHRHMTFSAAPTSTADKLEVVRATLEEAKFALFCSDTTIKDRADQSIRLTLASLAPPAATSGPTYVVNCCNCGRIIDTREESEGGDQWGHELSDDRWVCSPECLDAVTDPDAVPAATSAETQGGDGMREAFEQWGKAHYVFLDRAKQRGRSYLTEKTENLWLAFQAGAALAPPAATSAETQGGDGVRVTRKLLLEWSEDFDEASKKFERLEKCVLRTRAQECRDLATDATG